MGDLKSFFKFFAKFFAFFLLSLLGLVLFILHLEKLNHEPRKIENLHSKATSLKYVEDDVLGDKVYETCPRSSYIEAVETVQGEDGGSSPVFDFKFRPRIGNEKKCPAVTVSISRSTGEAWIMSFER